MHICILTRLYFFFSKSNRHTRAEMRLTVCMTSRCMRACVRVCVCVASLRDHFGLEEVGDQSGNSLGIIEVDVMVAIHGHHRVLWDDKQTTSRFCCTNVLRRWAEQQYHSGNACFFFFVYSALCVNYLCHISLGFIGQQNIDAFIWAQFGKGQLSVLQCLTRCQN